MASSTMDHFRKWFTVDQYLKTSGNYNDNNLKKTLLVFMNKMNIWLMLIQYEMNFFYHFIISIYCWPIWWVSTIMLKLFTIINYQGSFNLRITTILNLLHHAITPIASNFKLLEIGWIPRSSNQASMQSIDLLTHEIFFAMFPLRSPSNLIVWETTPTITFGGEKYHLLL